MYGAPFLRPLSFSGARARRPSVPASAERLQLWRLDTWNSFSWIISAISDSLPAPYILKMLPWSGGTIPGLRALFSRIPPRFRALSRTFARFARRVFLAQSRASGLVDQAFGQKLPPPRVDRSSCFCPLRFPFLLNPWLPERIRKPKRKCLRNTNKLAGNQAQRGRGPGNPGSRAPKVPRILPRTLGVAGWGRQL